MIEAASHLVFFLTSWLVTYFIQSTLFLSLALLLTRYFFQETACKRKQILLMALLAPVLTTSLCLASSSTPVKYHASSPFSPVPEISLSSASFLDWFTVDELDLSVPVRMQGNDNRTLVLTRTDMNRFILSSSLVATWLLLVLISLLCFVYQWHKFRIRHARRSKITDSPLCLTLEKLRIKAGIRRPIHFTASPEGPPVAAIGFSEICLMSKGLPELNAEEMQNILAHELTHLKKLDPLLITLTSMINLLFFFQPLNRIVGCKLQRETEFLADQGALALTRNPDTLATSLLKIARERRLLFSSPLVPNFAGRKPMLVDRTKKILEWNHKKAPRHSPLPTLVLSLVFLILVSWIYPSEALSVPRFWAGQSFTPPDLLADQTWYDKKKLKLLLPSGDRLHFVFSHVYIDVKSPQLCKTPSSHSRLSLEGHSNQGEYRIEINGEATGSTQRHFFFNGTEKPFTDEAVCLLRNALLVMIDND